ncbi:glycosyltransferase [Myxococcus qinghaiensis]|uniref:glycosyltransferase n=1 Tax=Myxococcus qinghaiensis TaxID=2906758 RepID=UPI0020A72070|nr:nucleotide disphospho-sugar-binding domain-containing protein [Myxococcus qinghaiensis]MCP3166853.1 hypothetical protein [Myxococcus qinghaiensis]
MRFLFCPLDTHGFVHPAIGQALALRQLGHQVAFATGRSLSPLLERLGLERIPRGEKDGASFSVEKWFQPLEVAIQYKHIEYALKRFPADVLVGQPLSLGAVLVRERMGVPLASLGLLTHLWPSSEVCPAELTEAERRWWWRHADMLRHYNNVRELFRMAPVHPNPRESPLLGDVLLLRSVPELAGPEEAFPGQVHLVGDCLWEPPEADPELAAWLECAREEDRPILYVQHGRSFTGPSFWTHLQEALGDQHVGVVAATSRMDHRPQQLPAHFYAREFIPQAQVLAHARAVVSSATTTTVLGALTHGLPSLLLPGGSEQPDVAEQVASAGAAICMPPAKATAETLRKAVEELLGSQSYRKNAQTLQQAFARMGSPQRAIEILVQLGQTRQPRLRGDVQPTPPRNVSLAVG